MDTRRNEIKKILLSCLEYFSTFNCLRLTIIEVKWSAKYNLKRGIYSSFIFISNKCSWHYIKFICNAHFNPYISIIKLLNWGVSIKLIFSHLIVRITATLETVNVVIKLCRFNCILSICTNLINLIFLLLTFYKFHCNKH